LPLIIARLFNSLKIAECGKWYSMETVSEGKRHKLHYFGNMEQLIASGNRTEDTNCSLSGFNQNSVSQLYGKYQVDEIGEITIPFNVSIDHF